MFLNKIKARVAGLALAGAAMAIPGAASAGVVVKSSGPSAGNYPVGRQVADDSSITLQSGDKITVLVDGGTRVLQGPGTFRVGEGASRTRARFSNLTRRSASSRSRTGAVRSAGGGVPRRPNLWMVDVTAEGPTCLYDLDSVQLWRPLAEEAQTYTFTRQGSTTSLDVTFAGSEATHSPDPEGFELTPGSSYSIAGPGAGDGAETRVSVTFALMPAEGVSQPDELAQALAERGCMTQLALLGDIAEAEAQ